MAKAKKAISKKPVVKKAAPKKAAPKKTVAKKKVAVKAAPKKAVVKKKVAVKVAPKKVAPKKALPRKAAPKKGSPKMPNTKVAISPKMDALFKACLAAKDVIELETKRTARATLVAAQKTLAENIRKSFLGLNATEQNDLFLSLPWGSEEGEMVLTAVKKQFKIKDNELFASNKLAVLDDKFSPLPAGFDTKAAMLFAIERYPKELSILCACYRKCLLCTSTTCCCCKYCGCILVQDENSAAFAANKLQFKGAGVTATKSLSTAVVTIPGAVSSGSTVNVFNSTTTNTSVVISSIPGVPATYTSAFVIATGLKQHPFSGNTPAFVQAVITGDNIQFTVWDASGVVYPTEPNWLDCTLHISFTLILVS